jgi:hypothetical protein
MAIPGQPPEPDFAFIILFAPAVGKIPGRAGMKPKSQAGSFAHRSGNLALHFHFPHAEGLSLPPAISRPALRIFSSRRWLATFSSSFRNGSSPAGICRSNPGSRSAKSGRCSSISGNRSANVGNGSSQLGNCSSHPGNGSSNRGKSSSRPGSCSSKVGRFSSSHENCSRRVFYRFKPQITPQTVNQKQNPTHRS